MFLCFGVTSKRDLKTTANATQHVSQIKQISVNEHFQRFPNTVLPDDIQASVDFLLF